MIGCVRVAAIGLVAVSLGCEVPEGDQEENSEGFRAGAVVTSMAVEITAEGSATTLAWTPVPGSTYSVFRSTNPNFTLADPGVVEIASGLVVGELVDVYALDHDDPLDSSDTFDIGVFYQVVQYGPGGVDQLLPKVGRVSFGVVPSRNVPFFGPHYEFAKAALCLCPTPSDATLMQLEQHESLSGVHWWDAAAQHWVSATSYDAVLERRLGNVLSLQGVIDDAAPAFPANPDGSHGFHDYFELTGWVPPSVPPVCGPWETTLYEGLNAVAYPVISAPTTAEAIRNAMPGDVSVGRWDVVDQRLEWYPHVPADAPPGVTSVSSSNFTIWPCSAVYIDIETGNVTPDGTPISFNPIQPVWWPLYCGP